MGFLSVRCKYGLAEVSTPKHARAGIEPATFRFSGGVAAYANVFQLVSMG